MRHIRVALAAVGAVSVVLGVVMTIVSLLWLGEMPLDDLGNVIVLALFVLISALLVGEGVLMFVLPARLERAAIASDGEADGSPRKAGPPVPLAEPEVDEGNEFAASPSAASPAGTDEVARMFHRSNDVFATACDIVRMHAANPASSRALTHLSTMLETLHLEGWQDAPRSDVALLGRTHSYWLRGDVDGLDAAGYDRFVATEAAMNLDLALTDIAEVPYDSPAARQKTAAYLRDLASQEVESFELQESLGRAYPGVEAQDTPGEWHARASVVSAAESVRVPFRLPYDVRCNVKARIAVLRVEIPRPSCFCIVTPDTDERVAFARAYALRLSWLLSSLVLLRVPAIETLEVQCHEHGRGDTLLAIAFTRELVERLSAAVHSSALETKGIPLEDGLVARFGADDGWFLPVTPRFAWDSEVLAPRDWFEYPELCQRTLSDRAAEVTGARRVCDLGINENASRMRAADELQRRLKASESVSYETAVAVLVELRDVAGDVSLAEACDRTIAALLDGQVDPSDDSALRMMLVSDGALQDATMRAAGLLEGDGHADPQQAVEVLREALGPILEFGFYADDESCVYRYFGSLSERIVFNTQLDDHVRLVRLVPDSYYNALGLLASAYNMLGQSEDATAMAEEMMRIAPASVDAFMRKVRALENESRILEAANLIRECATFAATPRDAAFVLYRLAYMEWKLGREDLAAACYERALTWNTPFSDQSSSELEELLEACPHLKRPDADEALEALSKEGMPVGFTDSHKEFALMAAALMVDEHAFLVAQPLLSVVCAATGDDVYVGIRRSLDATAHSWK